MRVQSRDSDTLRENLTQKEKTVLEHLLAVVGAATVIAYATYLAAYVLGIVKGVDVTIYH